MAQYEIVFPEMKPEMEWVRGRPLQKVSPKRTHSPLQGALTMRLDRWAAGRGEVGPEWRFRVAPPGEARRPLVPDVAYVSHERLRPLTDNELEIPPLAPVDSQQRIVELHDGAKTVRLDETAVIEHRALPDFSYPVRELFAALRRS